MISSNEAFRAKLLEQSKADEEANTKKKLIQAKKKEKYRLRQRAINKAKLDNDHHQQEQHGQHEKDKESFDIEGLGYRDRVMERRKGVSNEVNAAEADWDKYNKLTVEESMYLGGDEATTHLVKGLDIQLANRIKEQIRNNNNQTEPKAEDNTTTTQQSIPNSSSSGITTCMGRSIARSLFGPGQLHPNRHGIPIIIHKQTIQIGHMPLNTKIKGSSRKFLNGKCVYNMNIDPNDVEEVIPMEVYQPIQDNEDEDGDTKLYVARYNEEISTEMIAAMLRKKTTGYHRRGIVNTLPVESNNPLSSSCVGESEIMMNKERRPMEPVDNDVDIFTNEEVNKGDGEDNNKPTTTHQWITSDSMMSRNYFKDDDNRNDDDDGIDEVAAATRLTQAVQSALAKRIENKKDEDTKLGSSRGGGGDFLASGDYDECYVGYGALQGFGHDVGMNKETFMSNKKRMRGNNKKKKQGEEGNNKGLDIDDDDVVVKKKSKMGESAQLKAIMKRVDEMNEG